LSLESARRPLRAGRRVAGGGPSVGTRRQSTPRS